MSAIEFRIHIFSAIQRARAAGYLFFAAALEEFYRRQFNLSDK